jgi:ABC-type molybdate transport system permease subunit
MPLWFVPTTVGSYAVPTFGRHGCSCNVAGWQFYNSLIFSSLNPVNSKIAAFDIPLSFIFFGNFNIPFLVVGQKGW